MFSLKAARDIHHAIHSNAVSVNVSIAGGPEQTFRVESTASQHVRFVNAGGIKFMAQNTSKKSAYAQRALQGERLTWILAGAGFHSWGLLAQAKRSGLGGADGPVRVEKKCSVIRSDGPDDGKALPAAGAASSDTEEDEPVVHSSRGMSMVDEIGVKAEEDPDVGSSTTNGASTAAAVGRVPRRRSGLTPSPAGSRKSRQRSASQHGDGGDDDDDEAYNATLDGFNSDEDDSIPRRRTMTRQSTARRRLTSAGSSSLGDSDKAGAAGDHSHSSSRLQPAARGKRPAVDADRVDWNSPHPYAAYDLVPERGIDFQQSKRSRSDDVPPATSANAANPVGLLRSSIKPASPARSLSSSSPSPGPSIPNHGLREIFASDNRPVCTYHPHCYRKNVEHLKQFAHPPGIGGSPVKAADPPQEENEPEESDANSATAAALFDKQWQIDYRYIKFLEQLGVGSFGQVRKGILQDRTVAVKLLHDQHPNREVRDQFFQEAQTLQKLRHPNIVEWLGICCDGLLCIVMEFVPSSLQQALKSGPIAETEYFSIAHDIASGLLYLHNLQPPIIHRDIKPANILLDQAGRAKIADFGISREDKSSTMTRIGTPSFMAPEIAMSQKYNTSVDVYSFGLLLWSMLTAQTPFADLNLNGLQLLMLICSQRKRPTFPPLVHSSLQGLIARCWDHTPSNRPSTQELCSILLNFKKSGISPIDPSTGQATVALTATVAFSSAVPSMEAVSSVPVKHPRPIAEPEFVAPLPVVVPMSVNRSVASPAVVAVAAAAAVDSDSGQTLAVSLSQGDDSNENDGAAVSNMVLV
ncbi:hypothetical protein CAOG_05099 [Capsaspora owczarzaki ATCC 30864]|uniref:TKL protein kinase n=1 Tax=Capsaspora owczarzaki (strain ATCC 30864) TaxID=595528 RepID=A0A0D2WRE5_CAPO3|nr:hypothetical protein CAOG_05099 [Capsaspora owczarzaki ATCC 30864]KJE94460.1 TKL protein kinase [Capsaspora owczarzaki ATCC 30864]|eukprot:XP_004346784.1 hypothetical protein CAOG_05099 [Capsaspora owczarzaki ATCC 30864]